MDRAVPHPHSQNVTSHHSYSTCTDSFTLYLKQYSILIHLKIMLTENCLLHILYLQYLMRLVVNNDMKEAIAKPKIKH